MARQVKNLIRGMLPGGEMPNGAFPLIRALTLYADVIEPWAESVGRYMLADVNVRNERAWKEAGNEIGVGLRRLVTQTPLGGTFQALLKEQVTLIKSIPLDAAQRAQRLVLEGLPRSTRSTTIAQEILAQSDIPLWRAKLIARTEVSRAAVTLTQVRAQSIGSQGYVWRTVKDGDVRPEHQKMEGVYVRWDTPPKTDKSLDPYHAGCGPNCRCFPEPILPEF